ncbi:MAG TPA: DUF5916 domain-containing protein, partial [Chitinophagaceae bacterium]|nr:DUF5916 domain-containing protein [Chitinophagaceae bacterium]
NFPPPAVPVRVYAMEATDVISVDGRLSEASWQTAPVIADFFRMEPRQGGTYLHQTLVRIVYDKTNIYFGVFCRDTAGKKGLRAQDLRRDFVYGENDVFYLQLDPQNLRRYCISFQTTPYGNQRDQQVFDDAFRDSDWDALWKVRTSITDSGYYAEFAIPFKTLRYDREADSAAAWGITLARLARRDYEVTVFPKIPQSFSPYRMIYAAELRGLKLPPPSANIRVQPYGLYQYSRGTNNTGSWSEGEWKAGGEVKWAVNPSAVLDLTFNTDFAQADVDQAVNNLTRFNVLFPERRQFFLENRGVYAGADVRGLKPFFSRSIGLSNTQFNAEPVPIDVGIRYTDRNQKRTLAGLYVRQQSTAYQGAAHFMVGRYLKNYGAQSNTGLMVTHRLDEPDTQKGFNSRNNTTLTWDGFIRPKADFNIQYLISASRNNTNDSIGFAGNFWVEYQASKWYGFSKTTYIDRKYVPGMGFVFATNTLYHNPGGYYIWRPKGKLGKLIRRWDPGAYINLYQHAGNLQLQQADIYLFPVYIILQSGGFIEYAITPTWQNIDFSFQQLSIPIEQKKYFYTRQYVAYNTDQSKKLSLASKYEWGRYYNGNLQTLLLTGRLAPLPNIALSCTYERNHFRDLGLYREDLETDLITASLRLAYNPRIQASVFYQYNSFDQQGRWNVRGSWEFAPLSFLYVVFNETSFRNSPVQHQSIINKITYLKQF